MLYSLFLGVALSNSQQFDVSVAAYIIAVIISFCAGMFIASLLRDNKLISELINPAINPATERKDIITTSTTTTEQNSLSSKKENTITPEQYNELVDKVLNLCDEYKQQLLKHRQIVKTCEKNLIIPQLLTPSQNRPLRRNRPCLVHIENVDSCMYHNLLRLKKSYSKKYAHLRSVINYNENNLAHRGVTV